MLGHSRSKNNALRDAANCLVMNTGAVLAYVDDSDDDNFSDVCHPSSEDDFGSEDDESEGDVSDDSASIDNNYLPIANSNSNQESADESAGESAGDSEFATQPVRRGRSSTLEVELAEEMANVVALRQQHVLL